MCIEELYVSYLSSLTRYLYLACGNRQCAEDAAQEAFIRAWQHCDMFSNLTLPQQRAWLNTTGRRILIDTIRKDQKAPVWENETQTWDDFSDLYLESYLRILSPEDRLLVELRHFSGFSSVEIGKTMHLPPSTVRTRLRAAMKQLRQAYQEQEK